ncbi:hypothetical protein AB6813_17125 [bacterium RCC_150]
MVFVHLDGTRELLDQRVNSRPGHFMPPALLDSQLATLEALDGGEAGIVVDIAEAVPDLVSTAATWLGQAVRLDIAG